MALSQIAWKDGKIIPLEEAVMSIFSSSVQYGWSGFEGIRFYDTERGVAIFRLRAHLERLDYTARALGMAVPYLPEDLSRGMKKLIRESKMREGYIRPSMIYPYPELGISFEGRGVSVAIAIASWEKKPANKGPVTAKIVRTVRIHPGSTDVTAKIGGHYVNSILALREAKKEKFYEAILLDHRGFVAEASAANIFMVKNWVLTTPSLGSILPGITRDTIIRLARDFGYEVREKDISEAELLASDEVFLCGTAMEILPINKINETIIGNGMTGGMTLQLLRLFSDVVHGRNPKYLTWLTFVNS